MKQIVIFCFLMVFTSCDAQVLNKSDKSNSYNGRILPENVCHVVKDGGTERPFTGKYLIIKKVGNIFVWLVMLPCFQVHISMTPSLDGPAIMMFLMVVM